jgi:hypothetical protein
MTLPECLLKKASLYPSFSMGSLDDRVQVNFGEGKTQFAFDIKGKLNVSDFFLTFGRTTSRIFTAKFRCRKTTKAISLKTAASSWIW